MARERIARILCPVDFSEFSRRALHHADAAARWYQAELHVLHVRFEVMPVAVPALAPVPPVAVSDIPSATVEAFHEFVRRSELTSPAQQVVREGPVAAAIADYAVEIDADLMVLGRRGQTGLEHALIGSTTERLLHKATCPVLTIPEAGDEPGSAERVRFTHVLCAVDFSPSSLAALEQGLSFAHENDAKVSVLHVLEPLSEDQDVAAWQIPLGELVQSRRDDALHQLHTLLRGEFHAGNEPARFVELGGPARTILRVADQINADLIAMGARGRTALGRILFGSTTDTVIRYAVCPVLTTRA